MPRKPDVPNTIPESRDAGTFYDSCTSSSSSAVSRPDSGGVKASPGKEMMTSEERVRIHQKELASKQLHEGASDSQHKGPRMRTSFSNSNTESSGQGPTKIPTVSQRQHLISSPNASMLPPHATTENKTFIKPSPSTSRSPPPMNCSCWNLGQQEHE